MRDRRRLLKIRRRHPPGSAPGQIAPAEGAVRPAIRVVAYDADRFEELDRVDVAAIPELRARRGVIWVDVSGLGEAALIARLGDMFGLHRLALEDVVNTHQRPKVEEFEDHVFLVARMLHPESLFETEQVSMFLGQGFLLTFQERIGDCFASVRERLRAGKGRIRQGGADYLCYALIDAIVDFYFPALERYGETLEKLEDRVVGEPRKEQVGELHDLKRELLLLRRAIWPHREMINTLVRDEHPLVGAETRVFLRDCYDHTIQLMDILETYREIASGLVDVYISSVSAKLSETMKVLTIIATIFIPLGFIASLYGMNFKPEASPWNMPELGWRFGYPFALAVMLVTALGLLWYFRRKGWLGDRD